MIVRSNPCIQYHASQSEVRCLLLSSADDYSSSESSELSESVSRSSDSSYTSSDSISMPVFSTEKKKLIYHQPKLILRDSSNQTNSWEKNKTFRVSIT